MRRSVGPYLTSEDAMADEVEEFLSAQLSANELRALAEATDSIRNEDACVVLNPDAATTGRRFTVMPKSIALEKKLKPILTLRTDDKPVAVERARVRLSTDQPLEFVGNKIVDINQCDAIFTSLSAVEKFVVPYYARMRGLAECEAMRLRFAEDREAVALLHLPGSVETTARLVDSANMFFAGVGTRKDAAVRRLAMVPVAEYLKQK